MCASAKHRRWYGREILNPGLIQLAKEHLSDHRLIQITRCPSEKLHPTGREECGTVSWWIFECFCSASTMSRDENQWTVFSI